jgi:hypothetical protein
MKKHISLRISEDDEKELDLLVELLKVDRTKVKDPNMTNSIMWAVRFINKWLAKQNESK